MPFRSDGIILVSEVDFINWQFSRQGYAVKTLIMTATAVLTKFGQTLTNTMNECQEEDQAGE